MERKIASLQIVASANAVINLVEQQIALGISSNRIVLAGFSQGGAVCYQAALSYNKPLAGLMAMSTYFATHKNILVAEANKSIPIELFHGSYDDMVPPAMGQHALKTLLDLGYEAGFKTYSMGHEVCLDEIKDISTFLRRVLA